MSPSVDPKKFWEEKIIAWEDGRYGDKAAGRPLLERLADHASASLRFRLAITKKLLAPHVGGKNIVELGCGSGLLAGDLIALGAAGYRGYDISSNAVARARELAAEQGLGDKVRFEVCPVGNLPLLNADIIFSLGLLDWLDDAALEKVFEAGGKTEYLHAISEKRANPSQCLHRIYVFLAYGWRTGGYVPKYHSVAEIEALAKAHNQSRVHVYRNPCLNFSALISTLPLDG